MLSVDAISYQVHPKRQIPRLLHLQSEVILPCVGVRQARSALPRRYGERVGVVSRRVRREVLLEIGDHLVDRHAVGVQEGVVVAPARRRKAGLPEGS